MKIKEFTLVNDCFQDENNAVFGVLLQRLLMKHAIKSEQLTVPYYAGKEVKKGLLRGILKQANIKTEKR